jgi:hypothetical protein
MLAVACEFVPWKFLGPFPPALRWTHLDRNRRGQPPELALGYGVALTAPKLGVRLCRAHIGGCES